KKAELEKLITRNHERIEVIDASEIITNDEVPTVAIRKKTDSSLVKAFEALMSRDDIGGIVSAGSTGALLTGAFLKVGRIKGISRPALAPLLPTVDGSGVVLCDCGANVDCKAIHLLHFAYMANAFYKLSTNAKKPPSIALLSNGTEDKKGNEVSREAFELLKNSGLNFKGNIEARDILTGETDVVIADGFNGNIALKSIEGAAVSIFSLLKQKIAKGSLRVKIGSLLLKPTLRKLKNDLDYSSNGGAVFLGVEKVVVKVHGSAKSASVCAGIMQAAELSKLDIVEQIKKEIAMLKDLENE
ncbi:MAG: phosphate acyltransferase PlsX, partial [Clostridia bacterium]